MNATEDPRWTALSQAMRDKLLERHRDINVHDEWCESTYEQFKQESLEVGIDVERMYFSGFWSQGDGACFEGSVGDWGRFLTAIGKPEWVPLVNGDEISFSCRHKGNYSHEYSVSYTSDLVCTNPHEDEDDLRHHAWKALTKDGEFLIEAEDEFIEFFRKRMRQLYKSLEEEYEHLTSDEEVVTYIVENELDDLPEEEESLF